MRISVYSHDANPAVDRRLHKISAQQAADKVACGLATIISQFAIQLFPPKFALTREDPDLRVRTFRHLSGRMRATALNEGRRGQFTIGYPIPAAFEGHLTMPIARIINAPCVPTASL